MSDNPPTHTLKETFYPLLIDRILDYGIFMIDPQGLILSCNAGAQHIKGYTEEELLGKHFSLFYPPRAIQQQLPQLELEKARQQGRYEDEGWRVKKDGTEFWANSILTPLYDPFHQLLGFAKVTRDLTERKRAEDALRQSEEQYRLMVESTTDYAFIMLDVNGCIQGWNRGATRLFGFTAAELMGKHFSSIYPAELVGERFPDIELKQSLHYQRFEHEGLRMRKNKDTFWANVIITAVFNGRGKHIGYSKIVRELTEGKKPGEEMHQLHSEPDRKVQQRTEELLASNRIQQALKEQPRLVKADPAISLYTELRTSIINLGEWLQAFSRTFQSKADENELTTLDFIKQSVQRLNHTSDDIEVRSDFDRSSAFRAYLSSLHHG